MIKKKFIKKCKIGDLSFSIGINRSMAVEALENCEGFWDLFSKSELLREEIVKAANDSDETVEKEPSDETVEKQYEYIRLTAQIALLSEKIVDEILPSLLEYAETDLGEFKSYNEMATYIIETLYDCGALYDFKGNTGFYTKILKEFILEAFTHGGEQKNTGIKVIIE